MHILLTDVLVCPRCGPAFGLILLANRIEDRRVLSGRLGCANCREQYPIVDGTADLRMGATPGTVKSSDFDTPSAEATRIAALLGVSQGPAYVLLAGTAAREAHGVSALLQDVEVIALSDAAESSADQTGVSLVMGADVPIATGKMHGIALTGPRTGALLEECARALRPTGRLLVDPAPPEAEEVLRKAGLRTLAREGSVLLTVRG